MIEQTTKLGEVASWVRGLTYSKKDEVESGGISVLRATNIDLSSHKIVLDEIRHISDTVKVKDDKYSQVGDLLICTASGSKSHVGKVALIEEDLGMAFGGFMAAIRCNQKCYPRFLYYVLTSKDFKLHLNSLSDGANINNLKFSQIEEYEFTLPSLEEQQRIVAKLDASFAKIDTKMATALSKIENAVSFGASLLDAALSGIDASKHSYTLQQLLDMGWIESHLDGNHGSDYPRKSEFIDGGVPYISANCIHDGNVVMGKAKYLSPDRAAKLRKGLAKNGDILFAHNATVGPTAILQTNEEKVILGTSLTYYRCNDNKISNEYFLAFMRSKKFIKQYNDVMRQATRNQVPITKQRTFTFLVPGIDIQRKVAETVGSLSELTAEIVRKTEASSKQLNSLKAAILAQQFQPPQSEVA